MLGQYVGQLSDIIRLCGDTDGILIVDKNGIIVYQNLSTSDYWKKDETMGRHILDLYPELTEETSTILRALRTGEATYNVRQEIVNSRGERVLLDSNTVPLLVDGQVECVVDYAKFYRIDRRVVRGSKEEGLADLDDIITQDPAMLALKRRIRDIARTDSAVLIYGETGTGKELVAESLHSESRRSGRPFVAQNCAAIPANLLESIFFGTERGSYTGAVDRKGLFELADGGTLFLDEINSMDISLQVKLLKALEEKKVRHLGGQRDIPFDVRIVSAVNEEPLELIRHKRMRSDLYYRLGVIRLNLPPLRERTQDIPLLVRYFIDKYDRELDRHIEGISDPALQILTQYPWPGNIRELQNVIEGAFSCGDTDKLTVESIMASVSELMDCRPADMRPLSSPLELPSLGDGFSLTRELERYERELLRKAMAQSSSLSQSARLLGLSRQALKYKLQKYDL